MNLIVLLQMRHFWMSGLLINFRAFLIGPMKIQNWGSYCCRISLLYFYIYLVVIQMDMHIGPSHPSISIMWRLSTILRSVCIFSWKIISRTIAQHTFSQLIMGWVTKVRILLYLINFLRNLLLISFQLNLWLVFFLGKVQMIVTLIAGQRLFASHLVASLIIINLMWIMSYIAIGLTLTFHVFSLC